MTLKAKAGWLDQLLTDTCPVLAVRAAKSLLKMDGLKTFLAVSRALVEHSSCRVRADIAAQLGRRGGEDVKKLLLEGLRTEHDPRVKLSMVGALNSFRSQDVVDALTNQLDSEGLTHQLHAKLLVAIGNTRHETALERITPHLETPSWASCIQAGGLVGLGLSRNPAVLEVLVGYTKPEYDGRIRAAAATALAKLGDQVESVRSAAGEALIEILRGAGFREILAAMAGLAVLKEPKALDVLSQLHSHALDGRVRRTAYEAMVGIRKGRTTEKGLETLRVKVDILTQDNAKLRSRIDRIEPFDG
jgi:HEAT repeat protein